MKAPATVRPSTTTANAQSAIRLDRRLEMLLMDTRPPT